MIDKNAPPGKKIIVEKLYKIYGPHPEKALNLLIEGYSKEEMMKKTRNRIGVADVSFHVHEGEILVIMGLSGSGKSTLVRCLNRLIDPTSGTIFVNGEDITRFSHKDLLSFRQKHFGMVFQNFALFPHRNVLRNIEYGLEVQYIEPKIRVERSMRALEQVGLKGWEDAMPSQLSGGMQQRVGLARALALNADIMLMDEAFSALDPLIRRDMQDELITLHESMQKTIIFISHDLDEALKLGDRIILMKDGGIVQEGTAEEILRKPANEYVARFVEDVNMSKILTAGSVMTKAPEQAHFKTDGPKSVLRKMKNSGMSTIFVRKDKKLFGIVTAEDAVKALKRGETTLDNITTQDFIKVSPDKPAIELFSLLAETEKPLAVVVSEEAQLLGIVTRSSLLAALSDRGTI